MNSVLEGTYIYFVGNSVFPCLVVVLYNTKQTLTGFVISRLEKNPRLLPLNIIYLFCEVRYERSSLMRRIIVSASQASFSLSNSALWLFLNFQMISGGK